MSKQFSRSLSSANLNSISQTTKNADRFKSKKQTLESFKEVKLPLKSELENFSNSTHERSNSFASSDKNYFSSVISKNNADEGGNIKVICRVRPMNSKETQMGEQCCVEFLDKKSMKLKVKGEGTAKDQFFNFNFDRVFNCETNQVEIFEETAESIVDSVMKGFNGTILAYGQTSSGKSFTMQGVIEDQRLKGIMPRMMDQVFSIVENNSMIEFKITISVVELYQEKLKDLLDPSKVNLNIREDKNKSVYIEGVTEIIAKSSSDVLSILKKGIDNRIVSSTNMNEHSSRSHLILIMNINQFSLEDLSKRSGKLYLVDLAGSEKISKTGATGVTLDEAKGINKSLTTLGMVINALTDSNNKSGHIPYRDSKLTRILCESLGGNSKTALIITLSPSAFNDSESLSSLRFGFRAKKVKNKAKVNKEVSLQELKLEIDKLNLQTLNYQWKVEKLIEYIKLNGLEIPEDEELNKLHQYKPKSFRKESDSIGLELRKSVEDNSELDNSQMINREASNINRNKLNYTIREEVEELDHTQASICFSKKEKLLLAVDRTRVGPLESNILNTIKDVDEFDNIKVKYIELLYVVNQIEEEKKKLKEYSENLEKMSRSTFKHVSIEKAYSITYLYKSKSFKQENYNCMISSPIVHKRNNSQFQIENMSNPIPETKASYKNLFKLEKENKSENASSFKHNTHNIELPESQKNQLVEMVEEMLIDLEDVRESYPDLKEVSEIIKVYKDKMKRIFKQQIDTSGSLSQIKESLKDKDTILRELEDKANKLINFHIKNKPGVSNVIYNPNFVKWNISNFKNKFKNLKSKAQLGDIQSSYK